MANLDLPTGYTKPRTDHGGPVKVGKYKNTAAAIYKGDLVKKDGSGRILAITAAGDNPMGVAVNYVSATADQTVYVYDDLRNTSFEVQVDDNSITNDTAIGNFFDTTVTTGNTTTLLSTHELDGNASAEDSLILAEMVSRPDNDDALTNNKVRVKVRVDSQAPVIATT